ncbi:MAG: hypothetical protein JHC70_03400 [Rhodococcus sp.]|uniref:hypothetical protein n=1 Tax=Rhodococcus erythropolis TaxID=1833 RepID=UPI001A1E03D7|nr:MULTISPECIES: hypothetical protein [Rhodococcus]MBJ7321371.1 hypothetical protein [Rhodococcus sp. (in: high G+C Gram-positive bacteria)]MBY6388886.1 hypothetical protein [Rhodococcus erythropolis]
MSTTPRTTAPQPSDQSASQDTSAVSPEAAGTVWVDFGDGGSARWAGLSLDVIDTICAQLETVKLADTIT